MSKLNGTIMSGGREKLRAWLEYIAQTAIDWLDELDADEDEREDDDAEPLLCREEGWR